MSNNESPAYIHRRITATLWRSTGPGKERQHVWTRQYGWMDTAVPRAMQLALNYGQPGDVVEFVAKELGFQVGTMRVLPKNRVELEYSPLVNNSPSLLKLVEAELR